MQKNMALIVVDVQNGFTPGGNLAVAGSDQIIPKINQLGDYFDTIVLTQDWHPENHISFADNHPDQQAFQTIELDYGTQVLGYVTVYKAHRMRIASRSRSCQSAVDHS